MHACRYGALVPEQKRSDEAFVHCTTGLQVKGQTLRRPCTV